MRRTLKPIIIGFTLAAWPLAVLAMDTLPAPTPTSTVAPSVEQPKRLDNLKTRGASEIDRRLDRLQKTLDKVQTGTKLPATIKNNLVLQMQSETTALMAIKSKLAADTDLAPARLDVQKIIDDYRVYGVLLAKARVLATTDRFYLADERLQLVRAQLQHGINLYKQQGKNVTALQKSQDDLIKNLTTAESAYQSLPDKLINLPSKDFAASHKQLADSATALKTARDNLATAENDAKSILKGLRELKSGTPAPTPTPSPTPTPTP